MRYGEDHVLDKVRRFFSSVLNLILALRLQELHASLPLTLQIFALTLTSYFSSASASRRVPDRHRPKLQGAGVQLRGSSSPVTSTPHFGAPAI
jgi:hypothetical protein